MGQTQNYKKFEGFLPINKNYATNKSNNTNMSGISDQYGK
jgi:hypothetical protein